MDTDEWTVYIIKTESGKFYTGITKDIKRRFSNHKQQKGGARFFRISEPSEIVFQEFHPNRSEATKREMEIKKMSRQEKIDLIASFPTKGSDVT